LYFDPTVLVLDEGTSALDTITEENILDSLDDLKNKLAIVMITHRTATLRVCDEVIELHPKQS